MQRSRFGLALLMSVSLVMTLFLTGVPAAADEHQADASILVFSKTAGYRHASIPDGIAAIQQLGQQHGFAVDATEDAAQFTDENLAQYDAVVWLSTTGDALNDEQQAAFERYIQGGGGYAGIHAASDTEYGWSWYGGLVGAYFDSHPQNQTATVTVADDVHPSTSGLPDRWERYDEWYNFQSNPRGDVHVLATLDESTYSGGNMGADHPTAWCHDYDGGRAWYTGGGHTSESFSEPLFLEHILGGIQTAAGIAPSECGATEWENFETVKLMGEIGEPIGMTVLPDGRVLTSARTGEMYLFDPATNSKTLAADLDVYSHDEDGLQGIAADPNFADNGWVYAYYAPPLDTPGGAAPSNGEGPETFEPYEGLNYLSRFKLEGNTLDLSSEQVILEVDQDRGICCHNGGDIDFDAEGNLYLSTGDDANPFESDGYTPIDERLTRNPAFDAQRSSGNTNDLRGKLLRINVQQDGSYTIPEGNLFEPGTEGARAEIYAMGFRNPYRMSVDQETGWVFLGDYGPDAGGADPERGPGGQVEFNLIKEAGNYGWPYCTGDNDAYRDYDFATGVSGPAFDCEGGPVNDSPRNDGLTQLPPAQPAWIPYDNCSVPEFGCGSESPMGGPVYRYDPDLDSDTKFPAYYDGSFFAYEWGRGWVKEIKFDQQGDLLKINPFAPADEIVRPMDVEFGPDGSLYILDYGSGYFSGSPEAGVYRVDYVKGGRSPIAVAAATPRSGIAPLEVSFTSAGTRDPDPQDQGQLAFAWDLDGDGTIDSTDPNPTFTYNDNGTYQAQLTVTDTTDRTGVANVTITVGNTAPVVTIETPADGGIYTWGDEIPYSVTVEDAEDGNTAEGTIDCSNVTVQVSLGHDTHAHPLDDMQGCSGTFTTSSGAGHSEDSNLFWVVGASYTDAGGEGDAGPLTGEDVALLKPSRLQGEHYTDMEGVQTESTADVEGGVVNLSHLNPGDWVSYDPISLTDIDSLTFRVASNGEGGTIEVRADAPDGELLGSVDVAPTGGWQQWTDVTTEVTDPGQPFELFLVFTNAEAEPDAGLFNINFIELNGKGVASTTRPQVAITSPAAGEQVDAAPVTITAEASDAENAVASVEFFANGQSIGEDTDAPYSLSWDAADGLYTLTAVATNDQGLSTTSRKVDVVVGDILVREPWKTFASTTAEFFQYGETFVIDANGADVWTNADEYGAIYQDELVGDQFVATVKVVSQEATDQWAKAGIMVKNDMTQAGSSGGYAMMSITPGNGFSFQWDGDGNGFLDGNINSSSSGYPVWVRLVRDGSTFTGYASNDGEQWTQVGSAQVPNAAATQDLGMFATSHNTGTTGEVRFEDFTVSVPTVSAQADPTEGKIPLEVSFSATSTVPDVTYEWDFGVEGATATGPEATYTYTEPGVYTATVTTTDAEGATSGDSVQITANADCTAALPDEGFRMLFDGTPESMDNWVQAGPGGFTLTPDCALESFGGLGLYYFDQEFDAPYRLRMEWMIDEDENSGVFVGFPNPGSDPWVAVNQGEEIQIDPSDDPDSTTGAIYNEQAADAAAVEQALNPMGEWNAYEIAVTDTQILVYLNGILVNEWTDDDPNVDLSSGYVGIQNHGGEDSVFFRNIQIDAAETCVGNLPMSDEFDDASLEDCRWTKIVREDPAGYSVGDGALHIDTGDGTDMYGGNTDAENIVLQPVPEGAWEATTKVTLDLEKTYEQASMLVYGNDEQFAKLSYIQVPNGRNLEFILQSDGQPVDGGEADRTPLLPAEFPDTVHLKISSDGTNLSAAYSVDGETWTDFGRERPLDAIPNPHFGVTAFNGDGSGNEAHFDWFRVSPDTGDSGGELVCEDPEADPSVSTEFDGDALDACRWDRVVRYDPDMLEVADGELRIDTSGGDIYQTGNTDPTNFVLQEAPDGDWTIETKVEIDPVVCCQQAGLIVYDDDDTYVKFDVISDNSTETVRVELRSEIDGAIQPPTEDLNGFPQPVDDTYWLRLTKGGTSYTAAISTDGETWQDMPQPVLNDALVNPAFGVFALGIFQEEPVTAAFDHFHLLGEGELIDDDAPVVSVSLEPGEPDGAAGWYTAPVSVSLTADDADGSGVAAIEYQFADSWAEGEGAAYTEPIVVNVDGETTVLARATDNAGNVGDVAEVTVQLDTAAPTTTATVEQAAADAPATVTLSAEDETSGVAVTEFSVDGGEWIEHTGPFTVDAVGEHTVEFRSTDVAGNVEDTRSVSFTITEPDACPDGDDRPTVVIGDVDSGVANPDLGEGCTIGDLIDEDGDWTSHGQFVGHVSEVTGQLVAEGVIDARDRGAIISAAARSGVGR